MSGDSRVGTHCSVFALSDSSDPDFRQQCNHDHNERCLQCDAISATLADIEKLLSEASYPNDEDVMRRYTFAILHSVPFRPGSATS